MRDFHFCFPMSLAKIHFTENHIGGFKTSDQVQGQGAGRSRKRSPAAGGMSHLKRPATQPLSLRWGFETTSKEYLT